MALNLPPNRYGNPRISPDGRRLLIESGATLIETVDLLRGTHARLTAGALGTSFATWTADGDGVVFKRFAVPVWAAADGCGKTSSCQQGWLTISLRLQGLIPILFSLFAFSRKPQGIFS